MRRCGATGASAGRLTTADFQAPFLGGVVINDHGVVGRIVGQVEAEDDDGFTGCPLADHCAHTVAAAGPRSRASGRGSSTRSRNHGPAGPDGESSQTGAAHRVGHLGDEIGRGVVAPRCAGH